MRPEMLSYLSADQQDCSNLHSYYGIRNVFVFHYIISGKGTVIYRRKKFPVSAGQIFLVIPGEEMSYIPDPDDPYVYQWIDFNGSAAEMFIKSTGFSVHSPVSPPLPELKELFDFFLSDQTTPVTREATLVRLFSYLMEMFPAHPESTSKDDFLVAQNYILANLHHPSLTVEQTATATGISRSGLFRLFIANLGISPVQFIHTKRIENAKNMLNGKIAIKKIAFSCGYNDSSHFSRHFRKATGLSPSEYRKMQQTKTGIAR